MNDKKERKAIATFIVIIISGYLVGSAIAWETDPSIWDPFGRGLVVLTTLIVAAYSSAAILGKFKDW